MVDEMKNEIQGLNAARREDLKKWEEEMRNMETNHNQEIQQVYHPISFIINLLGEGWEKDRID